MLTREQVRQYTEQGCTMLERFLNKDEVASLLSDIESICSDSTVAHHDRERMEMEPGQGPDGSRVRRLYEPCTFYESFRALSDSPKMLDAMEQLLGPRRLVDWFTDGFGYPRTYHQTPDSLRGAFSRFTIDSLAVRHLTPDQLPLFPFEEYPPEFWEWMASRLGFYLMLKAHK